MTISPYLLTDGIAALAIVASIIGIYLTDEVIFQRARTRVLEAVGKKLQFPQILAMRSTPQKSHNEVVNYTEFHSYLSKVPLIPVAMLTAFTFFIIIWGTADKKGLYFDLITDLQHSKLFLFAILFPFIAVISLLVVFGSLLNFNHLLSGMKKIEDNKIKWSLAYLLRLKRYELYFLFASVVLIFLFFYKTFTLLIYLYPDFTIPYLHYLGTLKSYNPNGLSYTISATMIISLLSYFSPRKVQEIWQLPSRRLKTNRNFHELENEIYKGVKRKSQLKIIVTEVGGNKFVGYINSIGSILCVHGREYDCDHSQKEPEDMNKIETVESDCYVRWDYVTFIEVIP